MKIYFNASCTYRDKYLEEYQAIVKILSEFEHEVMSDHILNFDVKTRKYEDVKFRKDYYQWMTHRIKQADLMVAEVSFPSTIHVGHELTLALEMDKPVLGLYTKGKRPNILWGIKNPNFLLEEYQLNNLEEVIKDSLLYFDDQSETRFNLLLSKSLNNYLNKFAHRHQKPKSVVVRDLIYQLKETDQEMNNEKRLFKEYDQIFKKLFSSKQ
jgi:hypothetical protein